MKSQIIKRAIAYYSDWALSDSDSRTLPEMMVDFAFLTKTEHRPKLTSSQVIVIAQEIIEQIKNAETNYIDFCEQVYGSSGVISDLKGYRMELPDDEESFQIDQLIVQAKKEAEIKLTSLVSKQMPQA